MNEGTIDRVLRVVAGLALVIMAYTETLGVWAWIGIVPLVTGIVGWCPAYKLLGIKTCSVKQAS